MTNSGHFFIDTASISHERLQDEVIIINLASGAYLSGSGTAADLWTLISAGASVEGAANLLSVAYSADQAVVLADVRASVATLLEKRIISKALEPASSAVALSLPDVKRGSWSAPGFDEYTDMWDLLQFDPIHDVGEAGWPFATPTGKT